MCTFNFLSHVISLKLSFKINEKYLFWDLKYALFIQCSIWNNKKYSQLNTDAIEILFKSLFLKYILYLNYALICWECIFFFKNDESTQCYLRCMRFIFGLRKSVEFRFSIYVGQRKDSKSISSLSMPKTVLYAYL